jgi:hypothetical protein
MDNWSPTDLEGFFWSLGPAAVGLFLVWFGQTKVAAYRETNDARMRLATFTAYSICWLGGVAMLFAFVYIWIDPYLSEGHYISGTLNSVPINMTVSTVDEDTASVFYLSERTKDKAPVRTYEFVIHDANGTAVQRLLQLSFSSQVDEFTTGVDLKKVGNDALLHGLVLDFQEGPQQNGEKYYLLKHSASSSQFPLERATKVGFNTRSPYSKFANNRSDGRAWFSGLIAAYAQSAPSLTWTRSNMVSGLESASPKVRSVTIAELSDKVLTSAEYAATAEAVVSRKEESATLRGRWSVYEAIKAAILAARNSATRNGILDPPVPAALPLSEEALHQTFVDAISGTSSANDAAKWIFRYGGDRRIVDLLFREIEAEKSPEIKACYVAFAANVFYNWATDVFLEAKDDKHEWFVSGNDVSLIELFYGRVSALSSIAASTDASASQFLISDYGLGLFYAGLSLLPTARLKGATLQSTAEHNRWVKRSKELMQGFAARLPANSPILERYRYPFHRDIALAVAAGDTISQAAIEPASPKVNPKVADIACEPGGSQQ